MSGSRRSGRAEPTGRRLDATAFEDPTGPGAGEPDPRHVPPEIITASVRRIGSTGVVYAAAYTLTMGLFDLSEVVAVGPAAWWSTHGWIVAWTAPFVLGALIFGIAILRGWIPEVRAREAGLVFLVVGCFGIVFPTFMAALWHDAFDAQQFGIVLWVCVFIVGFSAAAPHSTRRALAAYLAAAASIPLALVAAGLGTGKPVTAEMWSVCVGLTIPAAVCALIGVATTRNISLLGYSLYRARELGSYRLTERIGAGGMGEVWRAEHTLLARPAAIKLIKRESIAGTGSSGADHAAARFRREAQVTASLRSPHTVELYDYGMARGGTFYYVMELLQGLDLRTLVERHGPLPAGRVVHILTQACDSLAEAHERGLIHRDVKPANMHLCRMGRQFDYVKVLDFGIVKLSERQPGTRLTMEGMVTGTPGTMAPEVVLQEVDIDHRADLYALGCVGYWLLAGVPVFEGASPMKVVMAHVNAPPVPPSRRTELEIPADVEAVVLQCLAKAPEDRIQSADELARRLAACQAAGTWTQANAAQWWKKHEPGYTGAPLPTAEVATAR